MINKSKEALRRFFFPPQDTPTWLKILPYAVLGLLTIILLTAGAYGWDYTNSSPFCGTTCHTMPPEYTAYQISPHANIACVECHIGRDFVGVQFFRKAGDLKHVFYTVFKAYEFPITAEYMRPARESCEKCHYPEKFSSDTLKEIKKFSDDRDNTPYSIYLVLKTGGGSKRQGQGKGIHWHIENKILYYPADKEHQSIPYVRVYNDDGSYTEYLDIESGFNLGSIQESDLREMDCITCHNRITHLVKMPEVSVDSAISLNLIDRSIPEIRRKSVEALRGSYISEAAALSAIAALDQFYQTYYADYYNRNQEKVQAAIKAISDIYTNSVYLEQKSDWNTHPSNVGHQYTPGCFRCHDGKHLNADQEAIRLECNLCHSIPKVAGPQQFVSTIEISRGPEPESHFNPNWITMHREVFNASCSNCHDTSNPGGTDDTSFCSNSACHGTKWEFAGFDAPKLREIIREQLPPEPTPVPITAESLTFDASIGTLINQRCSSCHMPNGPKGLDLTSYAGAMKGSTDGPVIVPGDSAGSRLVQVQSAAHFAQFSPQELDWVKQWIDNGAPEK